LGIDPEMSSRRPADENGGTVAAGAVPQTFSGLTWNSGIASAVAGAATAARGALDIDEWMWTDDSTAEVAAPGDLAGAPLSNCKSALSISSTPLASTDTAYPSDTASAVDAAGTAEHAARTGARGASVLSKRLGGPNPHSRRPAVKPSNPRAPSRTQQHNLEEVAASPVQPDPPAKITPEIDAAGAGQPSPSIPEKVAVDIGIEPTASLLEDGEAHMDLPEPMAPNTGMANTCNADPSLTTAQHQEATVLSASAAGDPVAPASPVEAIATAIEVGEMGAALAEADDHARGHAETAAPASVAHQNDLLPTECCAGNEELSQGVKRETEIMATNVAGDTPEVYPVESMHACSPAACDAGDPWEGEMVSLLD